MSTVTQTLPDRSAMLAVVEAEKANLQACLDAFYAQPRRDSTGYQAVNDALIDTVDRILKAGDWDGSRFLQNSIQPLRELREEALNVKRCYQVGQAKIQSGAEVQVGEQAVYIALYQANGSQLNSWARMLRSLDSHIQGRAMYLEEADAQQAMRAKLGAATEAYVKISVKPEMIQHDPSKTRQDRLGLPIVRLVEGVRVGDRIVEFVHQGKVYSFSQSQLQPKG